jgi:Outer membrane protein beta-barrel domain
MKKLIIVSVLMLSGFMVKAQISFGVKAGLNLSNFSGDVPDRKTKTGFHLGGLVHIPLKEAFSLQPEIQYSKEGSTLNTRAYDLGYLNIPVMVKYSTGKGFYGEAGPQIGLLMTAKYNGSDVKDGLNQTCFGVGLGAGYKMGSGFGFGVRYMAGFNNILKGSTVLKPTTISIGAHYLFSYKKATKSK